MFLRAKSGPAIPPTASIDPMEKRAQLIPNVVGFPSASSDRYARELTAALTALDRPDWSFTSTTCAPTPTLARALGDRMASRHARFLKYPALLRNSPPADIHHILDHCHADLTLAIPPERTVLTCHDIIPLLAARRKIPVPGPRFVGLTFPLRLRCLRRCRKIIVPSEHTKRDLIAEANFPSEQIAVVPHGVSPIFASTDDPTERNRIRTAHAIPPDAHVLLHVATPMRYKNSPTLLRALHRLAPNTHLLRVGADFFDDEKQLIAELHLADRIHFVGRVPTDADLAAHYRAADVFVFPSLYEGFGWPALEAMACGTPAVTSNAASLPEIVGNPSLTHPPQDHEALADILRPLLDNPGTLATHSRQARDRAAQFTWQRCAAATLDVYEQVTQ